MANIFWNDEKASKPEAKKSLMEFIADVWTGGFTVAFHSDDGGEHIMAVLEVSDPGESMDPELRSKFDAKWMGWRMVVLKVPIGHVRTFFNK
tara:strand:+ start:2624 stop:2899 length:276 start_codon:yes stop_codon:yes gene_type:complete